MNGYARSCKLHLPIVVTTSAWFIVASLRAVMLGAVGPDRGAQGKDHLASLRSRWFYAPKVARKYIRGDAANVGTEGRRGLCPRHPASR